MKYLVGIDEAGRGPLAGPVAVGIAVIPTDFDWGLLPGVGDSKKLQVNQREAVFKLASNLEQQGILRFSVVLKSAKVIDNKGIVPAIKEALSDGLAKLTLISDECDVRLDGSLRAPAEFLNQNTIIKGDATEPIIGLASILAKVTRDRYMDKLAKKAEFSGYCFDQHKGYGTKLHRTLIKEHGISKIHRVSFCRNLTM